MSDNHLSRAQLLMQQGRYVDAEKILVELLAADPNDVYILMLMAEVRLQFDDNEKAMTLINSAIGIDPGMGILFYMRARILIQMQKYDEAETNLQNAIEINPADSDFYGLWASVKLARKQYQEALNLANISLELDAENISSLNIRSTALLKLDQKEESFQTIEGALREDPNNTHTHANFGWNLLEKGDHKKALEHFKEALKNNPNNDYAKAGMVEALKANNLFYRLFLKYAFWIGNLTAKYQWFVIIGFYLGVKAIGNLADRNPGLQPFLNPLIIILAILAFSTWVISPISNLFLRLNKYGRYLLNKKEIISSNLVGISFLIFLGGLAGYLLTKDEPFLLGAIYGFAMMVPLGVMFNASKPKHILLIYTIGMAILGVAAIYECYYTGRFDNSFTSAFALGFLCFQFLANLLSIRENNI